MALTAALALPLPGDYLPLGGPGGINQHGELAVVEQAQRAEQPTAGRDRFSLLTHDSFFTETGGVILHSLPWELEVLLNVLKEFVRDCHSSLNIAIDTVQKEFVKC